MQDEEDAPIDASEIDGANELGDEGTHLERKPTFSEPVTAPSKDNGVGTRREAVELTGPVAAALSSGPRGKAQVPSMGTSWLSEEAPGFKSRKDTSGEASGGARQPELSSSGQKQEEDADLLDVLLGRSSRAVTEGNGRIQGSGSARPAASEESLPERGEGGAVEQSRGKSVTRDLPPTGDALLRELSGGVGASFQEPMRGAGSHLPKDDSDRMELGGGGSVRTAFREADRTGSQTQQGEKASPAEDDIDALLAVLNPSASNTQAYVTADRAASNGGAMGGVRTAVTSAGSTSTAAPSNQLPESALLGSASSLSRGLASSSRTEQKVTAPISARSKPTVPADQDFDAWLDSIS